MMFLRPLQAAASDCNRCQFKAVGNWCSGNSRASSCRAHSRKLQIAACRNQMDMESSQSRENQQKGHQEVQPWQEPPGYPQLGPDAWTKQMTTEYMTYDRNWREVEDFYVELVAGTRCLSSIGLAPAGQPAADMPAQQPGLEQQQQQPMEGPAQAKQKSSRSERTTYKLQVSYLGSSFCGWVRGNNHSKPSVQASLAAAIAATGLCERGEISQKKSKRAAGRAAKRAYAMQQAAAASPPAADGTSKGAAARCGAPGQDCGQQGCQEGQPCDAHAQVPFVTCGGRTDAGVTAAGQVASFYSWQPPVDPLRLVPMINQQLQDAWEAGQFDGTTLDSSSSSSRDPGTDDDETSQGHDSNSPGSSSSVGLAGSNGSQVAEAGQMPVLWPPTCPLRVWEAQVVPRQFHPTFAATWRRYVYLLPMRGSQLQEEPGDMVQQPELLPQLTRELHHKGQLTPADAEQVAAAPDVDPHIANALLQPLQGQRLNYFAYARDTPKGKECDCTLLLARASLVWLPQQQANHHQQQRAPASAAGLYSSCQQCPCLAVELVGDRFLRKMVRVLVGTMVREAVVIKQACGTGFNGVLTQEQKFRLVHLALGLDRSLTAGPAPALGLCFSAVGYK